MPGRSVSHVLAPIGWRAGCGSTCQHTACKHVQPREQEDEERREWRIDHPRRRLADSHGNEIGDDGHCEGDCHPPMALANPCAPVQCNLR